jgi:hypothetical protein
MSDHLTGFQLFDRGATFLEKDPVTAVGTPYIDVDLNLLFAPCTLVRAGHVKSRLFPDLGDDPVNRTLRDLHRGSLRLVGPTGELEPALAAFPDAGAPALD